MEKVDRRRDKIYRYICERINSGFTPSVREIGHDLNIASTSTVHSDLKALKESGLIEMDGNLNRTIRLPGGSAVRVPLIGQIVAGTPLTAPQNVERYLPVNLPDLKPEGLFAWRVKDDSMMKAAILNGDIVIAEQTSAAQDGQIIVAMLENGPTVKRYYKEGLQFRLQPENDLMQPVIADSVTVLGRVLCVQRYYS